MFLPILRFYAQTYENLLLLGAMNNLIMWALGSGAKKIIKLESTAHGRELREVTGSILSRAKLRDVNGYIPVIYPTRHFQENHPIDSG